MTFSRRTGASIRMISAVLTLSVLAVLSSLQTEAFSTAPLSAVHRSTERPTNSAIYLATETQDELGLTPELRQMTNVFASIPSEKMRYKQLLYMANELQPVGEEIRVPENLVPGCLSTVHIDCAAERTHDGKNIVINYVGDSDGLLTKGLVALLVRGLSGCTSEQISRVNPEFISAAKISQSLTPGRNNGFLNMLNVMKKKAQQTNDSFMTRESKQQATNGGGVNDFDERYIVKSFDTREGKPMYNAIMSTLIRLLKPTNIELVDDSSQHAGHAGSKGWKGESHFALKIISNAFDGLSLVKRHQLIYLLLGGDIMSKIHALQISAKTPLEENDTTA